MPELLVAAILVPLLGAVTLPLMAQRGGHASPAGELAVSRMAALVLTAITLGLTVILTWRFVTQPASTAASATVWQGVWLAGAGIDVQFGVGLDGLSLWFFGLSALLMLTSVLVSWDAIHDRPALFYGMLLLLESGCLGVFAARDIILFYVFFEFTLMPLFFLIGIWGSQQRRYAATKFFLYTLAGSLLTFLGLLAIVLWHARHVNQGTLVFSISQLAEDLTHAAAAGRGMPQNVQLAIFLALWAGFAIKVPLFPLHTWLPLAHVEAPTAGSVFLAGILLKIGTYGFVRFSIPMLPGAAAACALAAVAFGGRHPLRRPGGVGPDRHQVPGRLFQREPPGLLHAGPVRPESPGRAGRRAADGQSWDQHGGSVCHCGHDLRRYHTRNIDDLGGLARRAPWLAMFTVLFALSSIGLPGLNGFAGELLLLVGMFQRAWSGAPPGAVVGLRWISVLAVFGVVLGAWYMLALVRRLLFGPLRETPRSAQEMPARDLSGREILALRPWPCWCSGLGSGRSSFSAPWTTPSTAPPWPCARSWISRSRVRTSPSSRHLQAKSKGVCPCRPIKAPSRCCCRRSCWPWRPWSSWSAAASHHGVGCGWRSCWPLSWAPRACCWARTRR